MTQSNAYQKPVPIPSPESMPFWEACRRHELVLPRCDACGHYWFPPGVLCPACLSTKWTWTRANRRGAVYTFGVYHRMYHKGFQDDLPYALALVELEEGPRLYSNVVGCAPGELHCGMRVEVVFEDVAEDATLYKFRPVR